MDAYIPVAGSNQQRFLGIGPDGRYVYVSSGHYVSVIDTDNNSVSSIPVTFDSTISGLAVSPDSRFVYAGLYSSVLSSDGSHYEPYNELAIIDTVSNTVEARIPTSIITKTHIAVNPTNGNVYVNSGVRRYVRRETGANVPALDAAAVDSPNLFGITHWIDLPVADVNPTHPLDARAESPNPYSSRSRLPSPPV
jgi:hypothetical protein